MSSLSVPQKARPRRAVALAVAAVSILLIGGFLALRLLRRTAAPAVPITAAPAAQTLGKDGTGKAGELVVTQEAMELAEIKIGRAQERLVTEKLAISGSIEPGGDRFAKITPRVAGKIVSLSVVTGDSVRAGQSLGQIESAELAQAQAVYQQAAARVAAARNNLQRQRELARLGAFSGPAVEEARARGVEAEKDVQEALRALESSRAGLTEVRGEREAVEALVAQAKTQVDVTKSRLNRAEALFKEELISRQDLEQIQADHQKAQADLDVARANVTRWRARLQSAETQVEAAKTSQELAKQRTRIVRQGTARQEKVYQGRFLTSKEIVEAEATLRQAEIDRQAATQTVRLLGGQPGGGSTVALITPISGRVQERNASVGETVDTEHAAFTVINLDTVWAQLAVAPRDLSAVRRGQRVELTSETTPGRTFTGTLSSIGSAASEMTRAVPVRVALENRDEILRPGAFVRGRIVTDIRRERVTVPLGALQEHTGKPTVYVAKDDKPGTFEIRHVTLGIHGEGWREIETGLSPGERIAVNGTFYLKSEALKSALSDGCCAVPKGE